MRTFIILVAFSAATLFAGSQSFQELRKPDSSVVFNLDSTGDEKLALAGLKLLLKGRPKVSASEVKNGKIEIDLGKVFSSEQIKNLRSSDPAFACTGELRVNRLVQSLTEKSKVVDSVRTQFQKDVTSQQAALEFGLPELFTRKLPTIPREEFEKRFCEIYLQQPNLTPAPLGPPGSSH